jgi:hypothetical protein
MFLMLISWKPPPELSLDIEQPIVQDRILEVLGCLVAKQAVDLEEVVHVVCVQRSSELENPNLVTGQSLNETKQDLKKPS